MEGKTIGTFLTVAGVSAATSVLAAIVTYFKTLEKSHEEMKPFLSLSAFVSPKAFKIGDALIRKDDIVTICSIGRSGATIKINDDDKTYKVQYRNLMRALISKGRRFCW